MIQPKFTTSRMRPARAWQRLASPMTYEECLDWIKALRYGEYEQTDGKLKVQAKDEGPPRYAFCCLGVFDEIHPCGASNPDEELLSRREHDEVDSITVYLKIPYEWQSLLANQNDQGTPFPDIANIIEENILPWVAIFETLGGSTKHI